LKLRFKSSFVKDLRSVKVKSVLLRVKEIMEKVERADRLEDIPNLKKLVGSGAYYRIRIGDYRIGLAVEVDTVIFVRILHRKDIYRYFP
jgi:mRNA interferase RelE/StbE